LKQFRLLVAASDLLKSGKQKSGKEPIRQIAACHFWMIVCDKYMRLHRLRRRRTWPHCLQGANSIWIVCGATRWMAQYRWTKSLFRPLKLSF